MEKLVGWYKDRNITYHLPSRAKWTQLGENLTLPTRNGEQLETKLKAKTTAPLHPGLTFTPPFLTPLPPPTRAVQGDEEWGLWSVHNMPSNALSSSHFSPAPSWVPALGCTPSG